MGKSQITRRRGERLTKTIKKVIKKDIDINDLNKNIVMNKSLQ